MNEIKKYLKIALFAFLVLLILITILSCFTTVPTGFVGVKTRFGKVQDFVIEVSLNVAVNYSVEKKTANKLYREVGSNYENTIIAPAILENVKSVTAQFTGF